VNVFENFPQVVEKTGLHLDHVVHVGAHKGQEMEFYKAAGITRFTLVEPNPDLAEALRTNFGEARVVEAACGPAGDGVLSVNRIDSSSTLAEPHPDDKIVGQVPVRVLPLRNVAGDADCAVVDAQGLELEVLQTADLAQFKMVICETCTVRDQTMASYYDDVVAFMVSEGFREFCYWVRSYQAIARYVREVDQGSPDDEIRDVVFIRA